MRSATLGDACLSKNVMLLFLSWQEMTEQREQNDACVDYVQSGYRNFTYRQEGDIKRYMNGQPDKEEAAGTVYKASLPFLKSDERERVKSQLSDIAKDMKEEHQQSRSRGFHM